MAKPVALILLNWNTPVHTANCITSVKQYCDEGLFDIIIADNGSTDNSVVLLKAQFPQLIYIENKDNLGFAEGNNRGLIYSIENGYTYSLVMNTDTLVDEDIVSKLSIHLNNHPNAAAVQPAIYWLHDKTKIWNGKGGFNQLLGLTYSDKTLPAENPDYENAKWVTGCCMLIRNSALVKSGLFNKQFFLYYEDVELSYRLCGLGFELHYLPSGKLYHEAGVSAKVEKKEGFLSPIIHYYITRNRIWFLRRYGNPIFYPIYVIGGLLYYSALWGYFKLRGRNEKAGFLVKGLNEGLFTPKNLIWPLNKIST
ncbi:MAG: glycosyltransferase family 2 protein [Mucilaginibacter sp.]|nr:glycosyltransferase family 2 protein [Mucilaginibacter sp.]